MSTSTNTSMVDTFVVLDLDRTLLDSDRLIALMCARLLEYGIPRQEVREIETAIRAATGQSLSVLEFLRRRVGADTVARLTDDLVNQANRDTADDDLLYGGAATALLDELDARDIPFAILTYGEVVNQEFKLRLFRRMTGRTDATLPAVVTDQPRKGDWIHAHWADERSDRMIIPAEFTHMRMIHARRIVIVDDKRVNLESPDDAVMGIHVDNRHPSAEGRSRLADIVHLLQQGTGLMELAQHYQPERQGKIDNS